jgi:integrase
VPLENAVTVAQAQAALRRLQTKREDKDLPSLKRAPKFWDYAQAYLDYHQTLKDAKSPRTLETERIHLGQWISHLGETRLNHITPAMINAFIAKRQGNGRSGRTVNLGVVVLRNVLKRAIDDGWLQRLPTENIRPLKWTARRRQLFTLDEIQRVCAAALRVSKNGQQLSDYLKLMAFSGARMTEALNLKYAAVGWERRQLTIGADFRTKNREARVIDFNPDLEAHLKNMHARRAPDSEWLFPSPQRGRQDRGAKTFRESLRSARKEAGMPDFGFHDCRHFFISFCVMSGVDFMTIARWAGHKDGGVLIGKVYGHLHSEHTQRAANLIRFSPGLVAKPDPDLGALRH